MSISTEIIKDIIMLFLSSVVGSYFTYTLAIKQSAKSKVMLERLSLYKPLFDFMSDLAESHTNDEWKQLENEANKMYKNLVLYAPDYILNLYLETMKKMKKGTSAKPVFEFMIALRKEIISNTSLKADDIISIEFHP